MADKGNLDDLELLIVLYLFGDTLSTEPVTFSASPKDVWSKLADQFAGWYEAEKKKGELKTEE